MANTRKKRIKRGDLLSSLLEDHARNDLRDVAYVVETGTQEAALTRSGYYEHSHGNIQNIMKTSGVSFANLDYRHRLKLKQVTSTVFKRTQNQRFQVHAQAKKLLDPGTRIQTILVKIFFIFFIYIMHKHIGA